MADLTAALLARHNASNAVIAHNGRCAKCRRRHPFRCDDGAALDLALSAADTALRDALPVELSSLLPRTQAHWTASDYWRYLDAYVRDGDPADLARMATCVTPRTAEQIP